MIPDARIGINDFVMIASGRLISKQMNNLFIQYGTGNEMFGIIKPIADLFINAPISADCLSVNDKGSIKNTSIIPSAVPANKPLIILPRPKVKLVVLLQYPLRYRGKETIY